MRRFLPETGSRAEIRGQASLLGDDVIDWSDERAMAGWGGGLEFQIRWGSEGGGIPPRNTGDDP